MDERGTLVSGYVEVHIGAIIVILILFIMYAIIAGLILKQWWLTFLVIGWLIVSARFMTRSRNRVVNVLEEALLPEHKGKTQVR